MNDVRTSLLKVYNSYFSSVETEDGNLIDDSNFVSVVKNYIDACYPLRLYRYRRFSKKNVQSLVSDEIYMSRLSDFNDPYEGILRYDLSSFRKPVNPSFYEKIKSLWEHSGQLPEPLNQMGSAQQKQFIKALKEIQWQDIKNQDLTLTDEALEIYKKVFYAPTQYVHEICRAACFSEDIQSILMWSHYADENKGYALGYTIDIQNENGDTLFPVSYSPERLYVEDPFKFIAGKILGVEDNKMEKVYFPVPIALVKGTDWAYEKEWRALISADNEDEHCCITLKPDSIYYGSRMFTRNKMRLHKIAVNKGLREFQMSVDYESLDYILSPVEM